MCGIIGMNGRDEKALREAGACFAYRGPDASAFFSDNVITLGHHRLAIVDLDPRSTQPFSDTEKKVWIVFNGEIFNFKEVREKLTSKYSFRTTSDTEVLVYAYREWGMDMTKHIEGMYALAIYDTDKKKVFLMRDHVGIKPLYYYAEGGVFAFASEQKGLMSILRKRGVTPSLDIESLDFFFALGYIPSPYSMYKGVKKLRKASYLEYDLVKKEVVREARCEFAPVHVSNGDEYMKLIEKKVLSHLIADVPVGVFFSGGTDSSLIASILHRHGIDLETFSIKLDYKTEDAKYFDLISKHLKLKSHVYDFNVAELDSVYEEVMTKLDEPTYDNSIFPTYFVSKKASEKVKVVLSGEGGDEFFYGYPRSLELSRMNGKRDYGITLLDYIFLLTPPFKAKNHVFQKLFRMARQPMSYYLMSMSPARDRATLSQWRRAKAEFKKRNVAGVEIDQEFYLEDDLLRKTDLATSYVSIEGRVPLLDIDIVRNASVVESEKLADGVLKAFLKKMLATYIPPELVYRSKSGFGVNMVTFFEKSAHLRPSLIQAIAFLSDRGIATPRVGNIDKAIRKYPHLCFSLIALHRSIVNNEHS